MTKLWFHGIQCRGDVGRAGHQFHGCRGVKASLREIEVVANLGWLDSTLLQIRCDARGGGAQVGIKLLQRRAVGDSRLLHAQL